MTSWIDLLQSLAQEQPMPPPRSSKGDLWGQQTRIEALEAEVRHLSSVLEQVLQLLEQKERS